MSRRQSRRARVSPQIPLQRRPGDDLLACPHCGHSLIWLTRAEFAEVCARFGQDTIIPADLRHPPGVRWPWWFCHGCHAAGAVCAV